VSVSSSDVGSPRYTKFMNMTVSFVGC
jgi:hypothetical protein